MVIDEHTRRLERLYQLGQAVDALHGIEVKAEDELGLSEYVAGSQLMLGKNRDVSQSRHKL